MSIYSMPQLMAVIQGQFKFDPLFLRLFFHETYTFSSEEVALDKIPGGALMAVYCAPLVTGKVDHTKGGTTLTFKPGYTKPKHTVNTNQLIRRLPGEDPLQPLSFAARRDRIIAQNLADEELSIAQLEEYQAVQAVLVGKYMISGSNIEPYLIDFGRSPTNNIKQAGSTAWSTQDKDTFDPTGDIDTYADNASGAIDVMVLDGAAWTLLNSFKLFREKLDTRRGSNSTLETGLKDLGKVVSIKGYYGDVLIIVYKGQYIDSATKTKTKYLPVNTMLLGNTQSRNFRTYGAIQDMNAVKAGITEATRYPSNWDAIGDPSIEQTMTQSAPAMATPDADAFVSVTLA